MTSRPGAHPPPTHNPVNGHSLTPCPSCHHPCTDPHGVHATCPEPGSPEAVDAALLARPGVMRALWWSRCRGCGALVHGPGSHDLPCPCGTRHAVGDVVGLADTGEGRRWVCRGCLSADVPAPRVETDVGVAR